MKARNTDGDLNHNMDYQFQNFSFGGSTGGFSRSVGDVLFHTDGSGNFSETTIGTWDTTQVANNTATISIGAQAGGSGGSTGTSASVTVANRTISLSANPTFIPRDAATTSTITATVKKLNNDPESGVTVQFSADSELALSATSAVTATDGKASVTAKSSSISSETDEFAFVYATVPGPPTTWAFVTLRGVSITLTTQYTKIYIGNPSYRNKTRLTATVKDTANTPCKGNVAFSGGWGTFDEPDYSARPLYSDGTCFVHLNPTSAGTVTAYATFGPLTSSVQVTFAEPTDYTQQVSPHVYKTDMASSSAKVYDQDAQLIPGASVVFHWEVPDNIHEDATLQTATGDPPPDLWLQDSSPSPSMDGPGWHYITCTPIVGAQAQLYFENTEEQQSVILQHGTTVKVGWENHGVKFLVDWTGALTWLLSKVL